MDNCKHCGHPIVFLNGYWRHYQKTQDNKKHGIARVECFSCECKNPERYEMKQLNELIKKEGF